MDAGCRKIEPSNPPCKLRPMPPERPEIVVVAEDAAMTGGAERVALSSARELTGRGYPVSLFTAGKALDASLDPGMFREIVLLDLPTYWETWFPAPRAEKLRTMLSQPEPARTFAQFLARRDPKRTLVHFHGFHSRLTHGVLAAALDGGFPSLLTMHDFGFTCPNATQFDYTENAICHRRPLSRACWNAPCIHPEAMRLKRLRSLRTLGQRTTLGVDRRLRHLAAVSRFAAGISGPSLHKSAKVHIVRNPIEAERTSPARPENAQTLLWAGRMTQEKDPMTAAAGAALAGIPIQFAGTGEMETRTRDANPAAEFLGWRRPEEVAALYENSRALVLTSRWYETASLVTLDAMSRGIPPVVPRTSAATEWFDDGVEGLTFGAGDSASLARALEQLKDDTEVARLGRAAYARFWADPPTMETHLDRLEEIYGEVLA